MHLRMLSSMKRIIKEILIGSAILLFWLVIWQLVALTVGVDYVFPSIFSTLKAFVNILGTKVFYVSVTLSVLRILAGFGIGLLVGFCLALLCSHSMIAERLTSPVMRVLKSTPVASFIIILWMMIGGKNVPIAISTIMVLPIIWQNTLDGFSSVDPQLQELAVIYEFGYLKRLRLIVMPTVFRFLLPGIVTSSGLAWKAGIAAEIICMTKNSIGKEIYDSKFILDGPTMFAWTLVVVILSVCIEKIIKLITERIKRNGYHY